MSVAFLLVAGWSPTSGANGSQSTGLARAESCSPTSIPSTRPSYRCPWAQTRAVAGTCLAPIHVSPAPLHEEMRWNVGCGREVSGVSVVRVAVVAGFDSIRVTGARENNLKDVSVEIPKRRLTVFTGVSVSGSGSGSGSNHAEFGEPAAAWTQR